MKAYHVFSVNCNGTLDFHHINDDKEAGIPTLIRQGSIEKLKTELRKCILLCSNCHREHHFLERKNNE